MTKKQTRDAWTYAALGFGVAALLAYPAIGAIMAYYKAPAGAARDGVNARFKQIAAIGNNG